MTLASSDAVPGASRPTVELSDAALASIVLTAQVERIDPLGSDVRRNWSMEEVGRLLTALPAPASSVRVELGSAEGPATPGGVTAAYVKEGSTIWFTAAPTEISREELKALLLHELVHVLQMRGDDGRRTLGGLTESMAPEARAMLADDPVRAVLEAAASCLQPGDMSGYRDAPCQLQDVRLIFDWLREQLGERIAEEWWPYLASATGSRVVIQGFAQPVVPTTELLDEIAAAATR